MAADHPGVDDQQKKTTPAGLLPLPGLLVNTFLFFVVFRDIIGGPLTYKYLLIYPGRYLLRRTATCQM